MDAAATVQDGESIDHYALLGVERDATAKDVRLAYRKLIEPTDERSEREALAHAYGVLTNENRRAA
jgi:DnaJ-class molecular chaperone